MKQVIILLFLLNGYYSFAQTYGVYLNGDDFKQGKLSVSAECKDKDNTDKRMYNARSYVELMIGEKKCSYNKAEIFGFMTCDGSKYRFVKNSNYKILESKLITIYSNSVLKTDPHVKKGFITVNEYYFSIDATSEILPLTIYNLKKAFPDNHTFHDLLDIHFDEDGMLTKYDSYYKMYTVNHLLQDSFK